MKEEKELINLGDSEIIGGSDYNNAFAMKETYDPQRSDHLREPWEEKEDVIIFSSGKKGSIINIQILYEDLYKPSNIKGKNNADIILEMLSITNLF